MLSMQYTIVLPAAFDMATIRDRIASRGRLLDDFAGLVFKAYLYACQGEHGPESLYAPFYLWEDAAAMNRFLLGPGFVALTRDFGWPAVKTWSPLHAELGASLQAARFATREIAPIEPHAELAGLAVSEAGAARDAVHGLGALGAVAAYEPTTWTLVRLRLWRDRPVALAPAQRLFSVGHVSAPGRR